MDGIVLRGLVQRLGMVRILHGQRGIAHLSLQEGLVVLVGLGTVDLQGVLPGLRQAGVVPQQVPVPGPDGLLHLHHGPVHPRLQPVVDAGGVGDDEGGAVVALGLPQGFEGLGGVGADGHLGHVDVAVGHGDLGQILFVGGFAPGGELGHRTGGGGFGGLAAGVGIHLGVKDQDVEVLPGGQDMVQAAVADVVGPTVPAEDPQGGRGQQVGVL